MLVRRRRNLSRLRDSRPSVTPLAHSWARAAGALLAANGWGVTAEWQLFTRRRLGGRDQMMAPDSPTWHRRHTASHAVTPGPSL